MQDKFRLMMDSKAKTREEIAQELKRMIELKARPVEDPQASPTDSGESTPDISAAVRKSVQDRISSIVREAIQSAGEESYGEKIPPRETLREPVNSVDYLSGSDTLSTDDLAFAPSETGADTAEGSIRAKIEGMRRLGQRFYNGYMLRPCAEETLVQQGEYVRDVTDDFGRNCFCGIERPVYGALSTDQLRTYFTWRTLARSGVYNRTDKPYIILYCYELLNRIGVLSAADAYNRLSGVWEGCREFCPALDKLLPRWLKDFRAYNDMGGSVLPSPAENLGQDIGGDAMDILEQRYSGKLEFLMQRSSYNLRGSIFFTPEHKAMLESALEAALTALDGYFTARGLTMFELICGRLWKDRQWVPFEGAYVDLDRMDGFHSLRISPLEQYSVKRGKPCLEVFEQAPYRYFVGWVLKGVESVLRKRTGFRYGISPNITPVLEDMTNRDKLYAAVSEPEFQEVVAQAAEKWCDDNGIFPPKKQKKRADYNYDEKPEPAAAVRAPVEIDVSKLAKIRQEADETTRKLIVEEPDTLPQTDITERMTEIEEDSFEEQTAGFANDYSEYNISAEIPAGESGGAFNGLPEGWREFAQGLSAEDIGLLRALSGGSAEEYCRSRGVMPETEYDRINAAAMENIGDILIEDGGIIPDYAPDVENILSLT